MSTSRFTKAAAFVAILLSITVTHSWAQVRSIADKVPADTLVRLLQGPYFQFDKPLTVKTVVSDGRQIRVKLSDNARLLMLTPEHIAVVTDSLRRWADLPGASVKLYTSEVDLADVAIRPGATAGTAAQGSPVRRTDDGFGGPLTGRNIALWPSHGRYYEPRLDRWEWQRARLLTTVEDLLTPSFVLPFLIPMLENAGCMVFTPRERDTTTSVVIIDEADKGFAATRRPSSSVSGFGHFERLASTQNPFAMGKAHIYNGMSADEDSIVFCGTTESTGLMMTYIAYPAVLQGGPVGGVEVTVRHAEGEAHFRLDQGRGGSMWMPLAPLPFRAGKEWSVVLRGDGVISADAVRIGGGMGVVERGGETSGLPSWAEAARYYLQTDGFDHDKVLSISKNGNEYTDDINARGEWVNALVTDKRINIDLSFALHTDAGVTRTDSTIGTLALFTTRKDGRITFPDGRNRQLSRQMAGVVVANILSDIRRVWDHDWTFRGLADKSYSESRRPDVPSLLLELLSHQNVADMRLGLHPAFRRDVARAITKGIVRFLCGPDAPMAPLAPSRLSIAFAGSDSLRVSWLPTPDSLEPSAVATRFALYEGGRLVGETSSNSITIHQPQDGIIRTYCVVAIGPGGRSMPSEALPACLWQGARRALLVEGMDRLAAPATVSSDAWQGVVPDVDAGAPWPGDVFTTGDQYDYEPLSVWEDDDAPGLGASYADLEMKHLRGAATYSGVASPVARMMRLAGYSFVSQTKEAFDADTSAFILRSAPAASDITPDAPAHDTSAQNGYLRERYDLVRINLDGQRTTSYGDAGTRHSIYTSGFCRRVETFRAQGTRLVISGRFVGSDISADSTRAWCAKVLGFRHRTGHASRSFHLKMVGPDKSSARWRRENCISTIRGSNLWHPQADAIEPANARVRTVARWADTGASAAVESDGVLVVGE